MFLTKSVTDGQKNKQPERQSQIYIPTPLGVGEEGWGDNKSHKT